MLEDITPNILLIFIQDFYFFLNLYSDFYGFLYPFVSIFRTLFSWWFYPGFKARDNLKNRLHLSKILQNKNIYFWMDNFAVFPFILAIMKWYKFKPSKNILPYRIIMPWHALGQERGSSLVVGVKISLILTLYAQQTIY